MIPSASELEAWVAALETGHATTEMLPRFVEGYRRLLRVAEAARGVAALDDGDWLRADRECELFARLHDSLDTIELGLPDKCPDEGSCHGSMKWCERCGDVRDLCDDSSCDLHALELPEPAEPPAQGALFGASVEGGK